MQLYDNLIKNGNYLFKYRGQLPIIIFIISIPIIFHTSYYCLFNSQWQIIIQLIAIIISLSGLLCRYYITGSTPNQTSGRNRDYQIADQLNTTGAYSIVRNPLYLANYLIWIGISIYSFSYILCIIITLLFVLHYERIILAEEQFLLQKFNHEYKTFCNHTHVYLPLFKNYKKSKYRFSIKKILRQEYSSTLSTITSFIWSFFNLTRKSSV